MVAELKLLTTLLLLTLTCTGQLIQVLRNSYLTTQARLAGIRQHAFCKTNSTVRKNTSAHIIHCSCYASRQK